MDKQECLKQEGLFITELSDDFFENYIGHEKGLRDFIHKLGDKAGKLQKESQKGIWHCIFKVAVNEICKIGLKEYFGSEIGYVQCGGLEKVILGFYGEPFFLKLDVAQKMTYNLHRLSENISCNMDFCGLSEDEWKEKYEGLIEFGRGRSEEDLMLDLCDGLKRMEKKYEESQYKPKVFLLKSIKNETVAMESDFWRLNTLYIGNEKFQDCIYHKKYHTDYFDAFKGYIGILNKESCKSLPYIWEKMTNFNVVNIVSKFWVKLAKEQGLKMKEMKRYAECIFKENCHFLHQIAEMPNVLTRTLLLKMVFRKLMEMPKDIQGIYMGKGSMLLAETTKRYECLQEPVLEVAACMRWHMGGKKDLNPNEWITELEEEYSIELFESLIFSLNIGDGWHKGGFGDPIEWDVREKIDDIVQNEENRCLRVELEIGGRTPPVIWESLQKYELIQDIGNRKHMGDAIGLWKNLKEKRWIYAYSESLNDYLKEEDLASEITPVGRIVTMTSSEYGAIRNCEYEETLENLEKLLKPCLLSDYDNVIFESIYMEEEEMGKYKKIFNFLIYNIF